MQPRHIAATLGLLGALALPSLGAAQHCPSYEALSSRLQTKHGEQRLFTGLDDSAEHAAGTATLEFWANSAKGNWSLIVNKLVSFRSGGRQAIAECAFLISAGRGYRLVDEGEEPNHSLATAAQQQALTASYFPGCLAHAQLSGALRTEHAQSPIISALGDGHRIFEIFAGESGWTLAQTQIQTISPPIRGLAPLSGPSAQEGQQLCSTPIQGGASWAQFEMVHESI